jgi:thymidylate kinase
MSVRGDRGIVVHVDGIDGSGKSTLLNAAKAWADSHGLTSFDVIGWSLEAHRPPTLEEIGDADILFTCEPTHSWIGRAIRDEMIRTGSEYTARFIAHAYAHDRAVQIERIIRPFLAARSGRYVIQDRSYVSSLAYQTLQSERNNDPDPITVEWLLDLDGNRIAAEMSPDIFVFLELDSKIAMERLSGRTEKDDDAIFEHHEFQALLAERYRDPRITNPLLRCGTRIETIDGSGTREDVARRMTAILEGMNAYAAQ